MISATDMFVYISKLFEEWQNSLVGSIKAGSKIKILIKFQSR